LVLGWDELTIDTIGGIWVFFNDFFFFMAVGMMMKIVMMIRDGLMYDDFI